MKKKAIRLLILLVIAGTIMTGCVAGVRAESTPGITVNEDSVYLTYLNNLYQIDRKTGAKKSDAVEKTSASLVMYAPALVDDGYVYYGDLANNFHKVSADNLRESFWDFEGAKGWYQGKAAISDDLIITPSTDRNIYALNKESGELVWTYSGEFAFISEPVVAGDKIIVSAQDHHILVLDSKTGEEIYRVEMTGAVLSSPLYDPESGSVFAGSLGPEVISFNLETGNVNWTYGEGKNLDSIWGTPILVGDELISVDKSGIIIGLDKNSGEELWQNNAGGEVIAGAVFVEGEGILVAREDGTMNLYSTDTHAPVWTITVPGKIYSKPIVDGGQIFVSVINGDALLYTYSTTGVPGWSFNSGK